VGTVSVEKSELVAKLLDEQGIHSYQVLNAKYHEREAAIVGNAGKRGAITIATNMAGRGTDIKLAEGVREAGGLAILGTERHESRRIDNQLRGRAGRQGDPGSTRFYVSLEDEVARLFGGDRVKKFIDLFGSEEMDAEPLSQRMVTRSIERAQKQVELHNFEIRKHLLDYDLVMDKQRKYIYALRRAVLKDTDITERLEEMFENIVADAMEEYAPDDELPENWDLDGLENVLHSRFHMDFDTEGSEEETEPLKDSLLRQIREEYQRRHKVMADEIRAAFREQVGGDESQIDFDKIARKRIHDLELMVLLSAVDDKWIDHLYEMDYLRDSVRLRAFGQKDPLLEYKQEGFELFQTMIKTIEEIVVSGLFRLTDPEYRAKRAEMLQKGLTPQKDDPYNRISGYHYVAADKESDRSFTTTDTSRFKLAGQDDRAQNVEGNSVGISGNGPQEKPKPQPRRVEKVVGPNDPCTCGSGKKYKKCCGRQVV
jgi:preprotein translocase subunit SecA